MGSGVEPNEIARSDVDGADTQADCASIEAIKIHQMLQRQLEIADVVEAGGLDRPGRLQPRRHGPRGEEASSGDLQHFADRIIAERGIRNGRVAMIPTSAKTKRQMAGSWLIGAHSTNVRAATNFPGSEKSRNWLGDRYSMGRWRNGSNQGFYYGA